MAVGAPPHQAVEGDSGLSKSWQRASRISRGVLPGVLVLGVLSGSIPSSANAGEYVATNCSNVSNSAPDAVSSTNTSVYPRSIDCATGNAKTGLRVTNSGGIGAGYAYGAWAWYAPPGTVFSDLFFRYQLDSAAGHGASVTASNAGGMIGHWTSQAGWVEIDTIPITATTFAAWLECAGNCAPSATAHTYVKDVFFTISDSTNPTITGLGGDLLAGGVRRGTETLTVAGADNANLTAVSVRANGVLVGGHSMACNGISPGGPATSFYPCQRTGTWSIPIQTELLPDGYNSIEVCLRDLAFDQGASNQACSSRTIQVDNSCPSSGGVRATAIDARLQSGNGPLAPAIRTTSNRGSVARGTLSAPDSVAGSTVCLYEEVDLPGDGRELVDTARVRNDGSFALDIDPGPSRLFDVVYRYNNQIAERERLHLDSVVVPTFKVVGRRSLVNGQNVRFRGRLPGPNVDGRGVSLQAQVGRKWRTFKQVKADSRGTFRGLYRFTQTIGTASYVFRARVKRQGNYPYSPGSSKRRLVAVRG